MVCSLDQRNKTNGILNTSSRKIFNGMVNNIQKSYPSIKINSVEGLDDDILGYAKNGDIFYNQNNFKPIVLGHELSHVWYKAIEQEDPVLFLELQKVVIGSGIIDNVLSNSRYRGLSDEDLIHEGFGFLLQNDVSEQLSNRYILANNSFGVAMKKIFNKITSNIFGYSLDLEKDSVEDIIKKVAKDIALGKKMGLNKKDSEYMLMMANNTTSLNSSLDFINTFDFVKDKSHIDAQVNSIYRSLKSNNGIDSYNITLGGITETHDFKTNTELSRKQEIRDKFEKYGYSEYDGKAVNEVIEYINSGGKEKIEDHRLSAALSDHLKSSGSFYTASKHPIFKDIIVLKDDEGLVELLDITSIRDIHEKKRVGSSDNILNAFISDNERAVTNKGLTLKNTYHDVTMLKMGLATLYLKQKDPSIKMGRLSILSPNSRINSSSTNALTAIQDVKMVMKTKTQKFDFSNVFSGMMTEFTDAELDSNNYKFDYIESYNKLLNSILLSSTNTSVYLDKTAELSSSLTDYGSNLFPQNELLGILLNRLAYLEDTNSPNKKTEMHLINNIILELEGITLRPFKDLNKIAAQKDSSFNTNNPLMDKLSLKVTNAHNNIRNAYMNEFMDKEKQLFTDFTSEYSSYFKNDEKVFDHLLVKEDGKTITMRFKDENDSSLTPKDIKFIRGYKDMLMKYYKKGVSENQFDIIKDKIEKGYLPILKNTKSELSTKMILNDTQKAKDTALNEFTDFFRGVGAKSTNVKTYYQNSLEYSFDDVNRNKMLGISEDGTINENINSNINTDIFKVMNEIVLDSLKTQEFNKVLPYYFFVKNTMHMIESKFFTGQKDAQKNNLDWIETKMQKSVLEATKYFTEEFQGIEKMADFLAKGTSIGLLGLNLDAALVNLFQGIYQTTMAGAAGRFTVSGGNIAKAIPLVLGDLTMAGKMLERYGFSNIDIDSLKSINDKRIVKQENLYIMLSKGDSFNRALILMGSMIQDGSIDAYSMVDGRLVYDETKDKRFHKNGSFDPNSPLLKLIKDNAQEEGNTTETNKLILGYDNKIRNSLKEQADEIHGYMSKDNQMALASSIGGKLVLNMKRFLQAKVERAYQKTKESAVKGEYETVITIDADGNEIEHIVWNPLTTEGTIQSAQALIQGLRYYKNLNLAYGSLNKVQKANLRKLLLDALIAAMSYIAVSLIEKPKKNQTAFEKKAHKIASRTMSDFMAVYNPIEYTKSLSSGIVPLVYAENMLDASGKLLMGNPNKFMKTAPLLRNYSQIKSYIE